MTLLFSDGEHNVGTGPHDAARELKELSELVSVAFGADADEATLRAIATSPQHCYRCRDGRELRAFLAEVGATMSASLLQLKDASQALTHLQAR